MSPPGQRLSPDELARKVAEHIAESGPIKARFSLRRSVAVARVITGLFVLGATGTLVMAIFLGVSWLVDRPAPRPEVLAAALENDNTTTSLASSRSGDPVLGPLPESTVPPTAPFATSAALGSILPALPLTTTTSMSTRVGTPAPPTSQPPALAPTQPTTTPTSPLPSPPLPPTTTTSVAQATTTTTNPTTTVPPPTSSTVAETTTTCHGNGTGNGNCG